VNNLKTKWEKDRKSVKTERFVYIKFPGNDARESHLTGEVEIHLFLFI